MGRWKIKKLEEVGNDADKSLLNNRVSEKHHQRLRDFFVKRWGELNKAQELNRLRWVTVLHSVCELDMDKITAEIKTMREKLEDGFGKLKGIDVSGVVELEVCDISLMEMLASSDDELRKVKIILNGMTEEKRDLYKRREKCWMMVHFHGIVDLGKNADKKHNLLGQSLRAIWDKSLEVDIKHFHVDKTIYNNLNNLAEYSTKGGQENLIYKIHFGWDSLITMERQMINADKKLKKKLIDKTDSVHSDDTAVYDYFVENTLSLSEFEIDILCRSYNRLMDSNGSNWRDGYRFSYGRQVEM